MLSQDEIKKVFESIKYYSHGRGHIKIIENVIIGYEPYISNYKINLKKSEDGNYHFVLCDGEIDYPAKDAEGLIDLFDYVYSHRRKKQVAMELFRQQRNKVYNLDELNILPDHVTKAEKEELLYHINSNILDPDIENWFMNMDEYYDFWLIKNTIYKTREKVDKVYKDHLSTGILIHFNTGKLCMFKL